MTLWRVDEAASYLGIRPKTLYEWVRTGRVPHRKLGFNVRFDSAELARWVAERSSGGDEPAAPSAPLPATEEMLVAADEAARQLRRIETDLGAHLSFPERQKLKELAERLASAIAAARAR